MNGGQRRVERGTETGGTGDRDAFQIITHYYRSRKCPEKAGNIRKYPVKCVRITPARSVPDAVPLISTIIWGAGETRLCPPFHQSLPPFQPVLRLTELTKFSIIKVYVQV